MGYTDCESEVTYKAFARLPDRSEIPINYAPCGRYKANERIQNKGTRLPDVLQGNNPGMAKPAPVIVNDVTYKPDLSKIREENCTNPLWGVGNKKRVFDYIKMAGGRRRTRRRHGKRKHSTKRKHTSKRKKSTRRRKSCKRRY